MVIRELRVSGYRSIRELRVPLGSLNVLTGPNGCGKSNLYNSVFLLAKVASKDFARGNPGTKPGDRRNPGTDETRGQTERLLLSCAVARLARVVAVDVPHHVTQRGNARQYILDSDADRMVYLDLLRCHAQLHELSLVGYCLMSNHVHLVAIPVATGDSRVCRQHPRAFFSSRHCSG